MDTNAGTFYIVGIEADGYERLYSFHVTTEDALDPTFSGTLMTLADANPFQWAMIGFSAICLLFSVIMLIDCAKRRIKRKPLWILLILIGMLTLSLSYAEGQLNFNGNIGVFLFSYSYLKLFTTGAWTFRLVLPVGSILYLIFRKRLTVKEKYDSENGYFN